MRVRWYVLGLLALLIATAVVPCVAQIPPPPQDAQISYHYSVSEFLVLNPWYALLDWPSTSVESAEGGVHAETILHSGHLIVRHELSFDWVGEGGETNRYREAITVEGDQSDAYGQEYLGAVVATSVGQWVTDEPGDPYTRTTKEWNCTYHTFQNIGLLYWPSVGSLATLIADGDQNGCTSTTTVEDWGRDGYERRQYTGSKSVTAVLDMSPAWLEAVDPLTSDALMLLVTKEGISDSGSTSLALEGSRAIGAAADGATRLLIRALVFEPSEVTFSLTGSTTGLGELSALNGEGRGTSFTTTTKPVAGGHYAFCLYWAPDGLPADTSRSAPFEIPATVQSDFNTTELGPVGLTLYQPPVVLLHGIWSGPTAWAEFPLLTNTKFPFVYPHEYPNAAHLRGNAWTVHQATQGECAYLRGKGIAACRADVIGHSMGGLVGRYWGRDSNKSYKDPNNYFQGDIRRLITMNTPHYGTSLADWLYNTSHDWIRGPILVRGARMIGCPVDQGAIEDLRLGSPALQTMGASAVEGHALVGSVGQSFGSLSEALGYLNEDENDLWLELIKFVARLLGFQYDTQYFFGGPCHDIVVGCDSQDGGMQVSAITARVGQEFWHCNAPKSATYASRCDSLLTGTAETEAFSTFPAIPFGLASPGAWAGYQAPLPADAPQESPSATIAIISPVEGTAVAPGTPVLVSIDEAPSGSALEACAVVGPSSYGESAVGDPTHVSLTVPLEAVGDFPIMAIGLLQNGQYAFSQEVHLAVDLTGREANQLRFVQPQVNLEPGESCVANCLLECLDGVVRPLPADTSGITYLSIDESVATVDAQGVVTALTPGICTILARYNDLPASVVVTVRQPTADFQDVPPGFWAFYAIRALLRSDIVTGYSVEPPLYCPNVPVTRDQMAVYISRAIASGDYNVPDFTDAPTFPDVGEAHWALRYVEYAVDQGVVAGYDDGNYHPEYEVTRDQMAVYVARSLVAPSGEAGLADYVPSDPRNFPDVPSSFWSYKHVEYCVEHGVVSGYEDGRYHPEIVVTRDQMAVYVARAFELPM